MNINESGRALQHLLVTGFTLYTAPAAVCTRLVEPRVLESHPWAVTLDVASGPWCARLPEDDPWRGAFIDAAALATSKQPSVLCHYEGVLLPLPLVVAQARHARARLEVAKNLGVTPTPLEGLPAVPDAILEAELRRRQREAEAAAAKLAAAADSEPAPITAPSK